MSVTIYTNRELTGLAHALGASDDIRETLTALALANRAAYAMTYGEDAGEGFPSVGTEPGTPAPCDWTATEWANSLLYNCVSNGGRDFAPAEDRETIRRYAEIADALTAARTERATLCSPVVREVRDRIEAAVRPESTQAHTNGTNGATITSIDAHRSLSRAEVIAHIKRELRRRSGRSWSVTGGRGTAYGWITITSLPAARGGDPYGYLSDADAKLLADLLGLDRPVHCQGQDIPAGSDYYREYCQRASGETPTSHGTPYWD